MNNLEQANIEFCDNGFMLSFNYTDDNDKYRSRRLVFTTIKELYAYMNMLIDARNSNDYSSI
jgi:hypothetical protein